MWRIVAPFILGCSTNLIVNFIFNPEAPDFIFTEFLVAIIFSFIILETNRFITSHLNKRYSWLFHFRHRFIYHSGYLTLSLIFIINALGQLYTFIYHGELFELDELLVINIAAISCSFLIVGTSWASDFLQNWRQSERDKNTLKEQLSNFKQATINQQIQVQQGKNKAMISTTSIRLAWVNDGIVFIYDEYTKRYLYNGALNQLAQQLPHQLFFRITRSALVHRNQIAYIQSDSYGKIALTIQAIPMAPTTFTVSRLKAAEFRKWYTRSSTIDP